MEELYPLSILDQYKNLFLSLMQTVTINNDENIHRYAVIEEKVKLNNYTVDRERESERDRRKRERERER